MPRQLDLTALRSFLAVAEEGGVTRAAGSLNLTQSAVSMQIKRLEEALGLSLLDRTGRGVALTGAGEQLLGYARRLLALNDEALARLTGPDCAGELRLGVPHDIVYPAIPQVMQRFAADYPRMRLHLVSSFTLRLKEDFAKGALDVILTTEDHVPEGAERIALRPLRWVGAPGGQAWRRRPLPLAFEEMCLFRRGAIRRLDDAGIDWEMVVDSTSTRPVEVAISADLGILAMVAGAEARLGFVPVPHGGALPPLWDVSINLYCRRGAEGPALADLCAMIRSAWARDPAGQASAAV